MNTVTLLPGERLTVSNLGREGAVPAKITQAATNIIATVRAKGDAALHRYAAEFDGADLTDFRVPQERINAALEQVDASLIAALEKAAAQIRDFHQRQVRQSWFTTRADGTLLGVQVTPVRAAGIYVPGGRAQYPSTVLMNAIPAKVAGVERVVMATPPQRDGGISPATLAAAKVAGVDEIYLVGGAQAVAALAYGTESIPRVEKITGPGNAYVAAAKRLVSGDVGIDMIAGPSEVCVLADASAEAAVVAADLMAQAEHDPLATCYLVTESPELARGVEAALEVLLAQSPRAEITRTSLTDQGTIVIAPDLATAIDAVNTIAPEHLELHCADALGLVGSIRNAGAIFVGAWSSEPLGDYVAGPNHTLPTGGTAQFSSPLSVDDFVTSSSVICYTPQGLLADAPATQTMAQAEGLWAHALSAGPCRGDQGPRRSGPHRHRLARRRCRNGGVRRRTPHRSRGGEVTVAELSTRVQRLMQPHLRSIEPYDPNFTATRINLSANENTHPLPASVREAVDEVLAATPLNRYPDPMSDALRDEIAAVNDVSRAQVCVGNGGDELLYNFLLAFGGRNRSVLICPPCFSEYAFFAQLTETNVRTAGRDPRTLTLDACHGLVMVDEAYIEFAGEDASALPLLAHLDNLVILRTLSKAYGAAGTRCGYVMAVTDIIDALSAVRQIYSVNVLTQAVALALVRKRGALEPLTASIVTERARLQRALEELPGITVWPSSANFLLVRMAGATAIRNHLRDEYSILVRDFSSAAGLEDCLRITVGTPEENDAVIAALTELLP